jgi:simple sugar transport system ATP-binding protein
VTFERGSLILAGHDVTTAPLIERRARGIRIIPFERNVEGLSLTSPLWQNWSARGLVAGRMLRAIAPRRLRAAARSAFERWSVRFGSVDHPAGSLSGGNAQKVILSREIDDDATLIVAAQPTRGLDIAAMAFVWSALRDARARGCGVIVISSDLDELFDVCDRVVVFVSGRIAGEFRPPYDLRAVGAVMTAAHA